MEPQGPTTSGPPPAHITSSLQYTQPGPPITSQGKPPSYVNPDQGSTQQGSSASFTQQTWMQGKLKHVIDPIWMNIFALVKLWENYVLLT